MENILKKLFRWNKKELLNAIIGCFLFSFAINMFIVPNSLYNGGILGISQLIRTLLQDTFHLKFSFDISGLINFIINIPLFILAYKYITKTFFRRSLVCVLLQTLFLSIIPTPNKAIVSDLLTCVLIGGLIAGYGCGLILSASGSGGGTDIIGILISMRNRKLSVGKIGAGINVIIYSICGILYGVPIMVYSIIYTVVSSFVVDNTHEQNICSYVTIFTKNKPDKLLKFIKNELDRDATYWQAIGAYKKSNVYVIYSALSKYEMQRLQRHLNELDKEAFMIKNEGIGIEGNFKKSLTK